MEKRTAGVFCLLLILCAVLIGRMVTLCTKEDYIAAAERHSTYQLKLASTRGKIYDRNGVALAGGASSLKALIIPSAETSAALMKKLPAEKCREIESELKGVLPFTTDVSDGSCEGKGVTVYRVPQRYGDHSLAIHLVGSCGKNGGESGIEAAYDNWLSEAKGELAVICRVSASGRSLDGADRKIVDTTANSNCGVMLTIDSHIQNIAETAAANHIECGAVVILDVETGEILAMASLPGYNRNKIAAYLKDSHAPLVNRAVAEYNAGSVFKPVVAAAALESGMDPQELYHCEGSVEIGNVRMGCIRHAPHGDVNLKQAISRSCNTYFIQLAQQLGSEKILSMAQSLGFGKATTLGTHYCSAKGNLPDSSLLQRPAELANLSFGQGKLTVTSVQIAGMIAAIARKGEYIEPYVVKGLTDREKKLISQPFIPKTHRAMSETTSAILGECMRTAVLEGTAKAGASEKVTSAAKTGTAETGIIRNGKKVNQAWYAGYFPYEEPKYVCVVLAEDGVSGGGSAGPVFKEIADRLSISA